MTKEDEPTIEERITALRKRYAEPVVPPCRVCGGPLSVQAIGGGPTVWACTGAADGSARRPHMPDDHYSQSRWQTYAHGDEDVVAVCDALARRLETEATVRAALDAESPEDGARMLMDAVTRPVERDTLSEADAWEAVMKADGESWDRRKTLLAAYRAAVLRDAFDLAAFFDRKAEWSRATFGPGDRYAGVLAHIRKELDEIAVQPDDLEEWVDVVLLAMDGAWRSAKADGALFVEAMITKDAVNRSRSWPDWRTLAPGAVSEHIDPPSTDSPPTLTAEAVEEALRRAAPGATELHKNLEALRPDARTMGLVLREPARATQNSKTPNEAEAREPVMDALEASLHSFARETLARYRAAVLRTGEVETVKLVERLREAVRERTHNPSLPVLRDADAWLAARGKEE